MDAPGFSGMTHQYGAPFGGFPQGEEDQAWAGRGFDRVPADVTLEPVVDAA